MEHGGGGTRKWVGLGVLVVAAWLGADVHADAPVQTFQVVLRRRADQGPLLGLTVHIDERPAVTDGSGLAQLRYQGEPPRRIRIADLDHLEVDRDLTADEVRAGYALLELAPVERADLVLRATTRGGDAVAGARVRLVREAWPPVTLLATTDFDGELAVRDLPAGHYTLDISAPGCAPFRATPEIAPGGPALACALEVTPRDVTVRGQILDAWTGRPVAGATVELVHGARADDPAVARAISGATGELAVAGPFGGLRRVGPTWPIARRALARLAAPGYLDRYAAVEPDGPRTVAQLWPAVPVIAEREPNDAPDAPQVIPPTTTVRLELAPRGDVDGFLLPVPTDGILRIHTPAVPIALWMRVRDSARDTLVAESGFAASTARDWDVALRAGTYLLQIEHWGRSEVTTAPIELPIEQLPATDAFERNDLAANAADVAPGERWCGTLFPADDRDCLRFVAATPGVARIRWSALPIGVWSRLRTDALALVAETGAQAGKECRIDAALAASGAYHIESEPWGRSSSSLDPYAASLELVGADPFESPVRNDTPSAATPIDTGTLVAATLNPVPDIDVYRVDTPISGELHVRVSALPIATWTRVLDSAGITIAEAGAAIDRSIDLRVSLPRRGRYYIQVEHWGRSAWSSAVYLLRTAFYPNDRLDYRDNGSAATASRIAPDAPVEGRLAVVGDLDHYRLHAPARGILRVAGTQSSIPRWLRVRDPGLVVIAELGAHANRPVELVSPIRHDGWQTLEIEHWGRSAIARDTYRLHPTLELEDPAEDNDVPAHATPLPARTSVAASLLPAGDIDCYRYVAVRKGPQRLTATAIELARWARVFDALGRLVAETGAQPSQALLLEWEAPAPGAFVIQLEHWGRSAWSAQHHKVHAGPAGDPTPPTASLSATPDPTDPLTWTFALGAEGPSPIARFELDLGGKGEAVARDPNAAPIRHRFARAGWVTATLRVTDVAGASGVDFARFHVRDPRAELAAIQAELVRPRSGIPIGETLEIEAVAARADGSSPGPLVLRAAGAVVARWAAEP